MYPRTKQGEKIYRQKKRLVEINIIINHIQNFLQVDHQRTLEPLQILEFGSGNGFQIPYLQKLGSTTASDIYISAEIEKLSNQINFHQCSIADTPFPDSSFDLIFSNHVIEHIEILNPAFTELKRIGSDECLYAFAVPTNVWLLLSLPAQYYLKVRQLFNIMGNRISNAAPDENISNHIIESKGKFSKLFPRGHGVIQDFSNCYQAFKLDSWQKLFETNGFTVRKMHPVLLYASSEWPIVPMTTMMNRFNVCSSVLFLMQKQAFSDRVM